MSSSSAPSSSTDDPRPLMFIGQSQMVASASASSSFAQAPQMQMAEPMFFSYVPGCTKRRKRTPAHARKVLEDAFERDTKPNGAQRQLLADELDMTPRNVQIWFQNRRAKVKTQAKKAQKSATVIEDHHKMSLSQSPTLHQPPVAEKGSSPAPTPKSESFSVPLPPQSPSIERETTAAPASSSSSPTTDNDTTHTSTVTPTEGRTPSPSVDSTPSPDFPITPGQLRSPDNLPAPAASTPLALSQFPAAPTVAASISSQEIEDDDHPLRNFRRGSLPAVLSHSPPLSPFDYGVDECQRRHSIDNSLSRLALHPFADRVRMANGMLDPARSSSMTATQPPLLAIHTRTHTAPEMHNLVHQHSMVYNNTQNLRPGLSSRQVSPLSPLDIPPSSSSSNASYQQHHIHDSLYMTAPQRHMPLSHMQSGPLPLPDYSFGTASPPLMYSEADEDSSTTASSYDASSRFGSVSSISYSESSITTSSSLYSDIGSNAGCPSGYDSRRGSSVSPVVINGFGNLNVGSHSSFENLSESLGHHHQHQLHMPESENGTVGSAYASPSSTVSPGSGGSPVPDDRTLGASSSAPFLYGGDNGVTVDRAAMLDQQIAPLTSSMDHYGGATASFYHHAPNYGSSSASSSSIDLVGYTNAEEYPAYPSAADNSSGLEYVDHGMELSYPTSAGDHLDNTRGGVGASPGEYLFSMPEVVVSGAIAASSGPFASSSPDRQYLPAISTSATTTGTASPSDAAYGHHHHGHAHVHAHGGNANATGSPQEVAALGLYAAPTASAPSASPASSAGPGAYGEPQAQGHQFGVVAAARPHDDFSLFAHAG